MARLEALRDALTWLPGVGRHEPEAMPPTATAGGNGGVTLATIRTPAWAAPVQAAPAQAAPAAAAAQPDDPAVVAAAIKSNAWANRWTTLPWASTRSSTLQKIGSYISFGSKLGFMRRGARLSITLGKPAR
jgi:hypothetical protein